MLTANGSVVLPHGVEQYLHQGSQCLGDWCVIHMPSKHRLNKAPIWIDPSNAFSYRVCRHGKLHADPDSRAWAKEHQAQLARVWTIYISKGGTLKSKKPGPARFRHHKACDGCCK